MKVGLTYDLRAEYLALGYSEDETAEFDRPDTIDAIDSALQQLGYETDRIGHARQLMQRLSGGERWDIVFNIAEGLHGAAREAQVPAILDVFDIPYTFSDTLRMAVCLHKGMTKSLVRDAGVSTPRFALIERIDDLASVELRFPVFAKPVAEGTGKGVTPDSKIVSAAALADVCRDLLEKYKQPVLVEEFLPGREFTVGLTGTGPRAEVLGTLEIILLAGAEPEVYSYVNKERCEELVEYRPVQAQNDVEVAEAEALALKAWRALGCRDGGRIDLRSDVTGRPQFIEVNPVAGLHPQHSDLPMIATSVGVPYVELIRRIMDSALAAL